MVFLKMNGTEIIFQLLDFNVNESFSLWDKVNKKFIRQIEGVANINDIKFMKQDLFTQRYPNLRKNTQYIRHILAYENGSVNEGDFGFKNSANNQISQFITNEKNLGRNPLEIRLIMRKFGSGLETRYNIVAMDTIGLPKSDLKPQTVDLSVQSANTQFHMVGLENVQPRANLGHPVASGKGIQLAIPQPKKLEGYELELIEAFNNYEEYCSELRFLELADATCQEQHRYITQPRLKELYHQYYAKKKV